MDPCVFCRIVAGEIPADVVYADDDIRAFRDLNAAAPTHLLVVPTRHYVTAADLAAAEPTVLARMITVAADLATQEGLSGHRLVANSGAAAGQSVFHVHLHVLGGRPLSWPPG